MDEPKLGPAMMALTPMQRRFVQAMAADPFGSASEWARTAGYSDHKDGARVRAWEVMHNPKFEAAVFEFSKSMMQSTGPMLAAAGLLRIAADPSHKRHVRALELIANRVGLHEVSEHRMTVQHHDQTGDAMIERITQLAKKHGIDQVKLLGGNSAAPVGEALETVVDVQFKEIKDDGLQARTVSGAGGAGQREELLPEGWPAADEPAADPD